MNRVGINGKIFIVLLLCVMPFMAKGQMFRTIASTSGASVRYVTIYEYNAVDIQPSFPGGNIELTRFINTERRYPQHAYEQGVEGRVVCGFVVNTDGTVSDVTVMKSVEESLDREAVRVICNMPRWTVGVLDGTPVPVFCVLTVPFRR